MSACWTRCLAPAAGNGTRVVSRKGLQVGGRCYIAPELGPRVGERVESARTREATALAGEADRRARRRARDFERQYQPERAMDNVLAAAADGDRVVVFPPPATAHETPALE